MSVSNNTRFKNSNNHPNRGTDLLEEKEKSWISLHRYLSSEIFQIKLGDIYEEH